MKIGRNDPCHCGSGKKYKKCHLNHEQPLRAPERGVLRKDLEFGTSDDFTARMFLQILQIRDHIYHDHGERLRFDEKFSAISQNLLEARFAMDRCLEFIAEHRKLVQTGVAASYDNGTITITHSVWHDLNLTFKDFFIRGEIAIKGVVDLARFMDEQWKLTFLFDSEKKFQSAKHKFLNLFTDSKYVKFIDAIQSHRNTWYQTFNNIRNKIEHHGYKLPDIDYGLRGNTVEVLFPSIESLSIEELLKLLWSRLFPLCEEIVVFLMSQKLSDPFCVIEVPEDQRDPANRIRFKVMLKSLAS